MLALALMFAFVPFIVKQISERNVDTKMFATTRQIETAQTAARIFIRENMSNLPYETTIIAGDDFADILEPYGLPLGFVPKTAMGQNIALVIHKTPMTLSAYLELIGDKLSKMERAELARRIGFYATQTDLGINIGIELNDIYSDVVRRNETDIDNNGFLSELNMGENTLNNAGNVFALRGEFETMQINTLSATGIESGKKVRNNIEFLTTPKAVFQNKNAESALTLTRGTLMVDDVNGKTISKFGDTGNLTVNNAAVFDLSMTAGRTAFTGGPNWNVRGNLVATNINFSTERLDISSSISAIRGQDVFIDEETLEYSSKSGIETGVLYTSNITLRDQTSNALNDGQSGAVILDIRPAGTTMLPDALVSDINNDAFEIIASPNLDDGNLEKCKDIIEKFDGVYNKQSLTQYIICQYVFWQRLEKRIDIKQCLIAGRSDCE